jgi:hypothetical protein
MFTVHTTHINVDVGYADTRHTWERTLKITLLVLTFRLLVHYSIPAGLNYYWGRARGGYITFRCRAKAYGKIVCENLRNYILF